MDSKDQASQSTSVNYREGPRRIGVLVCLLGILVGGVAGELLRRWMADAAHQHALFVSVLNSSEVQDALQARDPQSQATSEIVRINSPWVKDLFWEDGRVAYFVLSDGSFFFDTPHPPAWAFPSVLLCPVLGFLIPWVTLKVLSWMGVGHFAKKQPPPPQASS